MLTCRHFDCVNRLGDNEVVGPSNRKKPSRQRSRNTNKIQIQTKDDDEAISPISETSRKPQTNRRRPSTTTERSSESKRPVSRTTTPEPPTTPDPGAGKNACFTGYW